MTRKSLVFFALVNCIYSSTFSQIDHYESVILPGDDWHYLVATSQPQTDWYSPNFEDVSWPSNPSGFGYADGDDATEVAAGTMSVYLRKAFEIVDIDDIENVFLDIDYDDGFVAYLNGTEIGRSSNLQNQIPDFNGGTNGDHEALLYQGGVPERVNVDVSLLSAGENLLAVEVHNANNTSSDLSIIPVLSIGIISDQYRYRTVPDWFVTPRVEQEFVSSNLPLIWIVTQSGQDIPNEPKVAASMKILAHSDGSRNTLAELQSGADLTYQGPITIEVRGSSSQALEKKQYAFTTYDLANEKTDTSLLGMPEENDWILNGLAYDPAMIRDYLSYQLTLQMGQYAARGKFCEVFVNGTYRGLYILQEKLKADKNRIDIKKLDTDDVSVRQITGGYIIKTDKTEGQDTRAWGMPTYQGWDADFVHEDPKQDEVTTSQHNYIENYFWLFANAVNSKKSGASNGYPAYIDLPSFVDFMLIAELSSNADVYQFSTYFHKDRGGKLRAGPPWDYNLCYGNDLFMWGYDRSHPDVWQFENGDNDGPKFWKDLYYDQVFRCYLSKRWRELSAAGQPLNVNSVFNFIDETVVKIREGAERDQSYWAGQVTFDTDIYNMKRWISTRIDWMNNHLGTGNDCFGETVPDLVISKIHYHPENTDDFEGDDLEFIGITNASGSTVDMTGIYFGGLGLGYQFPVNAKLPANETIWLASDALAFNSSYGFPAFDQYDRNLSNKSQKLQLLNAYGVVIDEVIYSDETPWPVEADGDGSYLNLTDLALDNSLGENWGIDEMEILDIIINGSSIKPAIQISPNPAQSNLKIESIESLEEVFILDLEGKVIHQQKFLFADQVIDVSDLKTGVYVLMLKAFSGKEYTRKLIKE